MISFFCPFCKHVIKAADECAGTMIGCEQCKLEIRVPQPAAPPLLPLADSSAKSRSLLSWWKRVLRREVSPRART